MREGKITLIKLGSRLFALWMIAIPLVLSSFSERQSMQITYHPNHGPGILVDNCENVNHEYALPDGTNTGTTAHPDHIEICWREYSHTVYYWYTIETGEGSS